MPASEMLLEPVPQPRRALGDSRNLVANGSGNAPVAITKAGAKLRDGSAVDVVGRGVIVHAVADDMMTDPSGSSGARVACGPIR
jgi:Cu-Zn family superoxide dismutase